MDKTSIYSTRKKYRYGSIEMEMILIILGVSILGCSSLLIIGMLYANHQIRYRDGYDRELESDYQALMEQLRK